MGMMLETTSTPAVRDQGRGALRLARQGPRGPAAGARGRRAGSRSRSPPGCWSASARRSTERAETIFALRQVSRAYGHVQEVIVQNFRAKPDTAMRHADDLGLDEYRAAIAVTRLVLGPKARVQAPPNLVDLDGVPGAARRRRRRLGRRLAADPRPRQPRAAVAVARAAARRHRRVPASSCAARLTVHPEYVRARRAVARPAGLGPRRRARRPTTGWRGPAYARPGCRGRSPTAGSPRVGPRPTCSTRDRHRGPHRRPALATSTTSTATGTTVQASAADAPLGVDGSPPARPPTWSRGAAAPPRRDPGDLSDEHALALMTAEGDAAASRSAGWPTTCAARPSATTSPTSSTGTSTSPTSATSAAGSARSPSAAPTPTPTRSRSTRSPTGPRRPGSSAPPRSACRAASTRSCPATAYFDLVTAVKQRVPEMHVHAFSPDGGRQRHRPHRAVDRGLPDQGPRGRPRLDARHRRGDPRRRGPLGAHQGQAADPHLGRGRHHRAPGRACRRPRR